MKENITFGNKKKVVIFEEQKDTIKLREMTVFLLNMYTEHKWAASSDESKIR